MTIRPRQLTIRMLLVVVAAIGAVLAETSPAEPTQDEPGASIEIPGLGGFKIGNPCVHANLALYPLVSTDPVTVDVEFVTLGEAMNRKLVRVHETRNVNKLSISNRSDKHVFIQAGDIVRGGHQDRMAAFDVVLPPRSGKVPLDAFCVESGRWNRRGSEAAGEFSSSNNRAGTAKLTLAARSAKSQGEVWKAVAEAQAELADSVNVEVRDRRSPTSLELTLESTAVKQAVEPFRDSLDDCVGEVEGAVGIAVAINGRLTGASLFAWPELFEKSWAKILSATSVEALAARNGNVEIEPPPVPAVGDFLWIPGDAKTERREIRAGLIEQQNSYNGRLRFVTRDARLGWVHVELLAARP